MPTARIIIIKTGANVISRVFIRILFLVLLGFFMINSIIHDFLSDVHTVMLFFLHFFRS